MNVTELIIAKREGRAIAPEAIEELIRDYVADRIPDYQLSAFLMAVYFQGMTPEETAAYTRAMIDSGERLDFSDIPGVKVDKHSTGGVGDKVTIPLAPLVAAAGVPVPTMSGRGLGHSGGTLDKLESIPGFEVGLEIERARRQLAELGVLLIGQTARVAPADKKLYALRDVTGTVESIPLICGSILSKKVASGVEALVMDVKTGSGAFMRTLEQSQALADQLVAIGTALGLRMVALITDMDQPLGVEIGNANEVIESIEFLRGGGPPDLRELVLTLAAEMIMLGGGSGDLVSARQLAEATVASGKALEKFARVIEAQGGDARVVEHPERLELSPSIEEIRAGRDGFIVGFATREIGLACNALGAGRAKVTDTVDHGVGLSLLVKRGDEVRRGDCLARIRHRNGRGLDEARSRLQAAITISDAPPLPHPLVHRRIVPGK
jgi:pyrimidine-nucleoside phosphorylase